VCGNGGSGNSAASADRRPNELLTVSGNPYTVYTPYRNAWQKKLEPFFVRAYPVERHAASLAPVPESLRSAVPTLEELGFTTTNLHALAVTTGSAGARALLADFLERIDAYDVALGRK